MKLKKILLAGTLLFSSTAFSQNLDYDVSGRLEFPLIR